MAKSGVIGAGYVGLPLAIELAGAGDSVVCVDLDNERVRQLQSGKSYVEDVDSAELTALVEAGTLTATSDYEALKEVGTVVIAVPTPLADNRQPDLGPLLHSSTSLASVLQPGQLVIVESTTYPGTTRERVVPLLEESGLKAGKDFNCAYSPERVDPGREDYRLENTPKVVAGVSDQCRLRAVQFYGRFVDTIHEVSTPEVAELAKLLENIFRSVNIALVNELAILCDRMEIDIWEVIDAAATKPFGFMRFEPGPGLGGHCLPVDPFYLAYKAQEFDFYPEFIELAGKINQSMPYFCLEKIRTALNAVEKPLKGSDILLLGVAYKPDVADLRESPALKLIKLLSAQGSNVSYYDPHVRQLSEQGLKSVDLEQGLEATDLAVVVTAHTAVDYEQVVARATLVLDFRGVTKKLSADNLVRL